MKLAAPHLLSKGSAYWLESAELEAMTGQESPLRISVTRNWIERDGHTYYAYAEFDQANRKMIDNIRAWIQQKRS